MYRKILVPLDGTTSAEAALNHVENLAKDGKAEVVLLRVLPRPQAKVVSNTVVATADEVAQREAAEALEYLNGMAWRLQLYNVKTHKAICIGDPSKEIAEYARDHNVDLIVMTPRKRNRWISLFGNDVAKTVMNRTRKPVLLLKGAVA